MSARNQLIALAQCADPKVVSLWIITNRGRINPCTAARAKCLRADRSAVGCFPIHSWFARQQHERAWPRDNNCSQWSTAHRLTIGAVADRRRFRIGFSFKRHVATVTTSIDFHDTGSPSTAASLSRELRTCERSRSPHWPVGPLWGHFRPSSVRFAYRPPSA